MIERPFSVPAPLPARPAAILAVAVALLACGDGTTAREAGAAGPAKLEAAAPSLHPGSEPEAESQAATPIGAPPEAVTAIEPAAPAQRQALFGDLHVHSSWSIDGFGAGVRAAPEQAYRYALGQPIDHASGAKIQLAGPPLDFMALTDHAEYLGVVRAAEIPSHPLHQQPLIRSWLGSDRDLASLAWGRIRGSFDEQQGLPALTDDAVIVPAWRELVDLANRFDEPGRFTALVGFEYSANPASRNLHRNVLFRGDDVPNRPFSAMDSADPEDLWRWMDRVREQGDDLLAIPHNANGSDGRMFARSRPDGAPLDRAWAERRHRNEPLAEILQVKGQSETHPILSPDDAWADFEITSWLTSSPSAPSRPQGSYVREALGTGLLLEQTLGVNPYRLGMIGSTDGHNASSPFEEANYSGKYGASDATPETRLGRIRKPDGRLGPRIVLFWSAAGLAGVWADANTRGAVFDALRRRESFATSGPRIRLRLFGSFSFDAQDAEGDLVARGYAEGVPMGGRLVPPRETEAAIARGAPSFLVAAQKDPLEADLERLQIVKGWVENGEIRERVYDVACADGAAPDAESHRCRHASSAPDPATCAPDGDSGRGELRGWWRDPDFDPSESAFYYARVLQVPTCRWSTRDALRLARPAPAEVPAAIQERAISSPIWLDAS